MVAPGEVLVTKGLVRLLPSWDAGLASLRGWDSIMNFRVTELRKNREPEGVKSCEIVTILTRWTVARYSVR